MVIVFFFINAAHDLHSTHNILSSKLELSRYLLEDSSEVTDGFLGYPNRLNLTFWCLSVN